jgi:serine/threonine-protein kinase ULK2
VSRRQSSRSIVSRPLSAFSTTSGTPPSQGGGDNSSPPPTSFALSVTPPFAIPASPSSRPPLLQQHSLALTRPLSVPQSPVAPYAANQSTQQSGSHSSGHNFLPRYSSSPSVVGGVLARAFSAVSLFGRSPTNVSSGLGGATRISSTRRKTALLRTGSAGEPLSDPAEEALVVQLEELAQKAFVVFELADQKLAPLLPGYNAGSVLGTSYNSPCSSGGFAQLYAGSSPQQQQQPHSIQAHRKSSSSNSNSGSDNSLLRADVICPEALLLYVAASTFLNKGIEAVSAFWRSKRSRESGAEVGIELNEGQ